MLKDCFLTPPKVFFQPKNKTYPHHREIPMSTPTKFSN